MKLGVRHLHRGEDDNLLLRADKGANSAGARWILGEGAGEDAILEAVGRGEIDTLMIFGDVLDPEDSATIDERNRSG